MLQKTLAVLVLGLVLAACGKAPDKKEPAAAAAGQALLIAAEDLHSVRSNALTSGPTITGSIQPERRADLRAEVSAVVLQVLKENGDMVRRGDLLVRLDDTSIRESLASADAATRAATQALDQAERQYQRMKTLRASGMTSAQQMEDAEIRRNTTQSDLEAAKTRSVQARQQLTRTEARAPFDGVVSERKVSAGDTAQIGKELLKIIDPSSLRFEGLVSADNIGSVQAGQPVLFQVNGYGDQNFTGKIRRVNPAANATTRQVEVLVDFADKNQPKLAGLYAEGHVETDTSTSLTIPATALVREGDSTFAWLVAKDNALKKASIKVGDRDTRTGEFVVKSGLTEGDRLIRIPTTSLKDGQKIELAKAAPAPKPVPATPAAPAPAKAADARK